MQCPACRAVYSNGLGLCPRCKAPATPPPSPEIERNPVNTLPEETSAQPAATQETSPQLTAIAPESVEQVSETIQVPAVSTLLEFPGTGRAALPQWRKDLSERVREIQERRMREAARELAEAELRRLEEPLEDEPPAPLGLVPTPDAPPRNPIVTAALARLERARQPPPIPHGRAGRSGAATALARFNDEDYQKELRPEMGVATQARREPSRLSQSEAVLPDTATEQIRERNLVVVPALPVTPAAATTPAPSPVNIQKDESPTTQPQPQRVIHKILDDELMAKLDAQLLPEPTPAPTPFDDRAPILKRITSGIIDLFVVAFASSPFAAIIELTNGNWADMRVAASMGGIVLAVMFLYLTGSVALAGRTWGMSLVSLRAVDVNTGLSPTTGQAVGRALTYMLSLAVLGLGLFYALIDAEGRAAHDLFSGTAVVQE